MKCHLIQFMECNLVYPAGVRLWDVIRIQTGCKDYYCRIFLTLKFKGSDLC